ncbi:nitroreductase family protein [Anaerosacchariphilus polymeriproducens]|uniref:Nitroreductase n=1 Tax=Anaerosacchariphilus polymeriproducens TaxID=1812858 RepID=A0A371AWK0_9FIRM|nr:nitroreductase family protein [Anaerosacchariphilus polymeriproducens]RDU23933.1 nitroreductase [Anaerosacchariphilus polymeriproducens]
MTLFETIYNRQSVRKYIMEDLSEEKLESIRRYNEEIIPLYPEIKTRMEIVSYKERKNKMNGIFALKAPYYLLFYSEKKDGDLLNAGYMLEQMVLYLAMKGLGSCYLANMKSKIDSVGNRLIIMLAFGKPEGKIGRSEKEAKRLTLDKLCVFKEDVNRSFLTMLEAARLAPSSFNRQPWRFVVYNKRMHMFCKRPLLPIKYTQDISKIDMGIALAHIAIAADDLWVDIQIKHLENLASIPIANNEYIASITLEN